MSASTMSASVMTGGRMATARAHRQAGFCARGHWQARLPAQRHSTQRQSVQGQAPAVVASIWERVE